MTLAPPTSRGVGGITVTDTPTAGEVLTATSTTQAAWQAAAAGLLTELFDETKGAGAATFDTGAGGFSTSLDHLLLVLYLRTTEVSILSSGVVTLNNDTGNNYDEQALRGRDTTASAADVEAASSLNFSCPGASAAAGVFGGGMLLIPNYALTTGEKSALMLGYFCDEAATGGDAGMRASHWRSTAAISRIIITAAAASDFLTGSRLTVYGIG